MNSVLPVALFALGGVLGRLAIGRKLLLLAGALSAAKLMLYPLLIWLLLGMVLRLDWFWVQSGVMLAAMPTASTAFVLAQRTHAAAEEVSAPVLLSPVAAAVLFPITAWLVTPPVATP